MMFAGLPLPKSLHYLGIFDPSKLTVSLVDGAVDSLQLAIDTFEQTLGASGIRPSAFGTSFYSALFEALGAVSAIHPHTNCPHCASGAAPGGFYSTQYDTLPEAAQAEATPIELFEWFMRNHSESKQIIVDRLRRDYRIVKNGGPA